MTNEEQVNTFVNWWSNECLMVLPLTLALTRLSLGLVALLEAAKDGREIHDFESIFTQTESGT